MSNSHHFYGAHAGKGGIDTAAAEANPNARIWQMYAEAERQKIAARLGEEVADSFWRIEDATWKDAYERLAGIFSAITEQDQVVKAEIDAEPLGLPEIKDGVSSPAWFNAQKERPY